MSKVVNNYVVGYGSLLSEQSRKQFSDLDCEAIPITLRGWQRAWHTRSSHEKQTYVGAQQDNEALLNGVLLEIGEISPGLKKREQDYQFVEVDLCKIEFHLPYDQQENMTCKFKDNKIWICQTLQSTPAEREFPIYQSYLDTCLIGCLETKVDGFIHEFIRNTGLWHRHWINDRANPQYPRAASISECFITLIDNVLGEVNILGYRSD